jgi:glyoxylase-like metal-dependent hydrolase (beta-lactamase superfamily II)
MRELPRAQAAGAPARPRHMIDPSALYEGALAVYGAQEMARSNTVNWCRWPAERVHSHGRRHDGRPGRISAAFIDTPGHAKHHHCIWDEATRGWFTGDTFG